jgi:hypothetical protein
MECTMRQVLQNLRTGEVQLASVHAPPPGAGRGLIRSRASLISAGTERMLLDFGKAGWLEKARQLCVNSRGTPDHAVRLHIQGG